MKVVVSTSLGISPRQDGDSLGKSFIASAGTTQLWSLSLFTDDGRSLRQPKPAPFRWLGVDPGAVGPHLVPLGGTAELVHHQKVCGVRRAALIADVRDELVSITERQLIAVESFQESGRGSDRKTHQQQRYQLHQQHSGD